MATDDPDEMTEEQLRAELAQQRRLNAMLQKQVIKLLDEVARLSKKPRRKRRKKPTSQAKADKDPGKGDPPQAPTRSKPDSEETAEPETPRRGPLSEELERHVEEHAVDEDAVECCSTPLLEARDPFIQERRDVVKAYVRVHQLRLHRAECLCGGAMHTAPTPPVAMPNGSMTAALIAFIVHGKCGLHLPLKRIIDELAAKGLNVPKSTMSNVMRYVADLVTPLVDRIVAALFLSDVLHLDGTGLDALHPGEPGKHRGQIAVCCNEQLTVYLYSPTKEGRHLRSFLGVGQPRWVPGQVGGRRREQHGPALRPGHRGMWVLVPRLGQVRQSQGEQSIRGGRRHRLDGHPVRHRDRRRAGW